MSAEQQQKKHVMSLAILRRHGKRSISVPIKATSASALAGLPSSGNANSVAAAAEPASLSAAPLGGRSSSVARPEEVSAFKMARRKRTSSAAAAAAAPAAAATTPVEVDGSAGALLS